MALYCSHLKELCCSLLIPGCFLGQILRNTQQFGGCFIFYFSFFPALTLIFLSLFYCPVYLSPVAASFLHCLYSWAGTVCFHMPPCTGKHKGWVPDRTGTVKLDERGFLCWNTILNRWRTKQRKGITFMSKISLLSFWPICYWDGSAAPWSLSVSCKKSGCCSLIATCTGLGIRYFWAACFISSEQDRRAQTFTTSPETSILMELFWWFASIVSVLVCEYADGKYEIVWFWKCCFFCFNWVSVSAIIMWPWEKCCKMIFWDKYNVFQILLA